MIYFNKSRIFQKSRQVLKGIKKKLSQKILKKRMIFAICIITVSIFFFRVYPSLALNVIKKVDEIEKEKNNEPLSPKEGVLLFIGTVIICDIILDYLFPTSKNTIV